MNKRRLYESIMKSVVYALNEEDSKYKFISDLNDYIKEKGLEMKPASKFQRVNAQSGKSYIEQYGKKHGWDKRKIGRMISNGGAPLTTIASDGTEETTNTVTINHTVLNNVGNSANRWAVETSKFKKKYMQDDSGGNVYKQKGGPMNAAQISEPISFIAPWGEKMYIDAGGYILQDPNDPTDVYGISKKDFENTYRFNESLNISSINKRRLYETIMRNVAKTVKRSLMENVSTSKRYHPIRVLLAPDES